MSKELTRREFLRYAGTVVIGIAAGTGIASCAGKEKGVTTSTEKPTTGADKTPAIEPTPAMAEVKKEEFWGSAGAAPQNRQEASRLLGVPEDTLTELNPEAGNPTVVGWVIGKAPYDSKWQAVIPAGTCVDFARSTSNLRGEREWEVTYEKADWNRAQMGKDGEFEGHKATIYWTPCEPGDGTPVQQ